MGWQNDPVVSQAAPAAARPAWADDPVVEEKTQEQPNTWGSAIKNVAEAGGKFASGAVSSVLGDVAGLAQIPAHATSGWMNPLRSKILPASIADPLNRLASTAPTDVKAAIQRAGTYQPSNPESLSSKIVDAPGKMIGGAGEYLSQKTDEATGGVPVLGNIAGAVPLALASVLGVKGSKLGAFDARKFGGPADAPLPRSAAAVVQPKVPTTEELTEASKKAYAAGKESGVVVPAKGYETALMKVRGMAKEEGINPTLHPKSTAVLKELEGSAGKDLTLQEAETLRKIALDAEDDLNPVTRAPTPDARLAGKIVDQLDESIDALSTNSEARALWARSRRSQLIDTMIKRAEIKAGAHYTQAGMEHALRQEFKQLALNPRRMRGLNKEQKAAIEKVAQGGAVENTLRALGKFDPTTGGMAAFASIGTSAGLAPLTGGASAALPVIGFGARRLATRATSKNVDLAREALVGRGMPTRATSGAAATPNDVAQALLARSQPRAASSIQAQIRQLEQRAGNLPPGTRPDSPQARALFQELAILERQLKLAESRGAAADGSDGPLSQ